MAYLSKNNDGTYSLKPSPNVKVKLKLEETKETYNLFEKVINKKEQIINKKS